MSYAHISFIHPFIFFSTVVSFLYCSSLLYCSKRAWFLLVSQSVSQLVS